MMLLLIVGAAFAVQAGQRPSSDSVDVAAITRAYTQFVGVKALDGPDGDSLIVLRVDSPPPGNPLLGFYRQHGRWFDYLVSNARGFDFPDLNTLHAGRTAAARLEPDFQRRLAADSQFNALVIPAIARYLAVTGVPVRQSLLKSSRRTIPIDTATRVATRFFYPDILTPTGILTHVCTVINAVRELPQRDPALEALAFSAIMGDIVKGDKSQLEGDFAPARRLMNQLDAPGASKEVRLSRAQGVMWASMSKSRQLRDLLLAEAVRERDVLPFVLEVPKG